MIGKQSLGGRIESRDTQIVDEAVFLVNLGSISKFLKKEITKRKRFPDLIGTSRLCS